MHGVQGLHDKGTQGALQLIRDLRDVGLDAELSLPQICVVGKQSSGKSSIIEALTGIQVPRASGTCTRCPFEIYTSKDGSTDFRCKVSVRCSGSGEGASLEKLVLCDLESEGQLPEALRHAQRIVLRPEMLERLKRGEGYEKLKAGLEQEEKGEKEFTSDAVVVELGGKSLDDLLLVDLPGLIQNSEERLIRHIRDMSARYMALPNTIIAMCLPLNDDLENQEVQRLAREHDKSGRRTIGILTKADLLEKGTEEKWLELLKMRKGPDALFPVRNPTPSELKEGSGDARKLEERFFKEDDVGKRLSAAAPCGIAKLQPSMSDHLKVLVKEQVPQLLKQLSSLEARKDQELKAMGEVLEVGEARRYLNNLVSDFITRVKVQVEAGSDLEDPSGISVAFYQGLRAHYSKLTAACHAACPVLLINEKVLLSSKGSVEGKAVSFELEEVKQLIRSKKGRELPLPHGPRVHRAKMAMIKRVQEQWQEPLGECSEKATEDLREMALAEAQSVFGDHHELLGEVWQLVQGIVGKCAAELQKRCREALKDFENRSIDTQDEESLQVSYREAEFKLKKHLDLGRQLMNHLSLDPSTRADLVARLEDDNLQPYLAIQDQEMGDAVNCMAETHAYVQISVRRFCDHVPQVVDKVLLREFVKKTEVELCEGLRLDVGSQEELHEKVAENPEAGKERSRLEKELGRIREGIQLLNRFH